MVGEVADLLAGQAAAKMIGLFLHYSPAAPRFVVGDAGRLRQILMNLLSNAVKFTEQGHVLVSVKCLERIEPDTAWIRVEVLDTGIGIPSESQSLLFQKFSQVDASASRRFGGTGLGLAICRQLVELMNGAVGVQSEQGQGSRFWFTVPLPIDRQREYLTSPADLRHLRAIVFSGQEVRRKIIAEQLEAWGARCITVSTLWR